MPDPKIQAALDAARHIPDPSQTAPPMKPFMLDLDSVVPNETPATLDPIPPRQNTPEPTAPEPESSGSSNILLIGIFGAVGGFGAMMVLTAVIIALGALILMI